jgi:tetratricopeptide (TPR) repeat protein
MKTIINIILIGLSPIFALPSTTHNIGIADFVQYNQYLFVDITGLADDALHSKNYKTAESLYYSAYNLAVSKKNYKLIGYALLGLGTTFRVKGQYDDAITTLNQCMNYKDNITDSLPVSLIYYNLALSYHYLNLLDSAIENYSWAISFHPNAYWAFLNRSDAYRDKQEYGSAILNYDQAIQLDSSNADVMVNLAEVYLIKNDILSAQYWYEQALKYKEHLNVFTETEIQEKIMVLQKLDKN